MVDDWKTVIPQQIENYNNLVRSFAGLRRVQTGDDVRNVLDTFQYVGGYTGDLNAKKVLTNLSEFHRWYYPTWRGYNEATPFGEWAWHNFPARDYSQAAQEVKDKAFWLREFWTAVPKDEEDREYINQSLVVNAKEFLKALDDYSDAIQNMLNQIYPERFTYKGFTVLNPDHMAKPLVNNMLSAIDYLQAYFKKRNMPDVLAKGIKQFRFEQEDAENEKTVAYFDEDTATIGIYASYLHRTRDLDAWMQTNLLHELGHYIHTHYLNANAKRFWDSWWDKINEIRKVKELIRQPVTAKERLSFYKKLVKAKFDLKHCHITDPVEQVRFTSWLVDPSEYHRLLHKFATVHHLSYKKMPDLTPFGEQAFATLAEAQGIGTSRKGEEYIELLGVFDSKNFPKLTPGAQTELASSLLSEESLELEDLALPTDYAQTNEQEDFAETFARFTEAPGSLSPLAQYRMKKTLSLSGLYGKPVMTFAQVVDALIAVGMNEEARQILGAYLKI